MSRIGKHAITVPSGVTVEIKGQSVSAKGKMGVLSMSVMDDVGVTLEDGRVKVAPRTASRAGRIMWATTRTLVANMVKGVSDGFRKVLEIDGVGYRAAVQGNEVVLQLGYSHEVRYAIPEGIAIKADKPTVLSISGIDCQRVGQVAAEIRSMRPPEPYKGKGIHYEGERIRRKEGKKK
ncbi:MAG: 50S ribosomal protein L6 [Alphaproteobacteria bacterium]|nr:MAG: 50S ribosomal protein L6 [Alphaproteobacteria bacterium]